MCVSCQKLTGFWKGVCMVMSNREEQILSLIRQNPMISQNEMARICGITRSGVAAHISNLVKKGYLLGKGYIVSPPIYVAVIGGINMDIYGLAKNPVVSQSSNVGKIAFALGGIGRNISFNLGRLGVPNFLLSVYGNDHNGDFFKRDAMANGMDITYCQQLNGIPTSTYLSVNNPDGSPILGLDDMTSSESISPLFLEERSHVIINADAVVIDSSLTTEAIAWVHNHCQRPIYARVVSVNKAARLIPALDRIDTLVLSDAETRVLTGITVVDEDSARACANYLHETGVQRVYLLLNGIGNLYSDTNEHVFNQWRLPSGKRHENGAASAVLSSLIWSRSKKIGFRQSAELAEAAAALAMDCIQSVNPLLSERVLEERRNAMFGNV